MTEKSSSAADGVRQARRLVPKNWRQFQHYRDRKPPWVKLHRTLLEDPVFMGLPVESRALAPMLWLLASESDDGTIDGDSKLLAFRLRLPLKEVEQGMQGLIDHGLMEVASGMLASASSLLANPSVLCTSVPLISEGERPRSARHSPPELEMPEELTPQLWRDWQEHRRKIKAPLTATAIEGFRREAHRADITLAEAVEMSIAQAWRGFQAKFLEDHRRNGAHK